jgi:hypothetical protein
VESRRQFLIDSVSGVTATWLAAHWPAALAAAQHARRTTQSRTPLKFEFLTAEQAAEVESIVARIIPADETPGAREAGVVYFIDRALASFARNDQKLYREGMAEVGARVRQMFPGVEKFSAATEEQQDAFLSSLDEDRVTGARPFAGRPAEQSFFETLRQHAVAGFLIDPDAGRGGNRDGIGWKLIGREGEHLFQPPFGEYDKDYADCTPAAGVTEKK